MKSLLFPFYAVAAFFFLTGEGVSQNEAVPVESKASPEALAAAKKLIEAADMKSLFEDSYAPALDAQIGQLAQLGLSDEGLKELRTAMLEFFKTAMPYEELEPLFIQSYATNFTKTELDEITAFYQTATGKKALKLTPQLMGEVMQESQAMIQAKMPELQALLTPIIQKHMKRPAPPVQ